MVQEEEVNGIREENLRLKTLLQQIEKDYKNLQMKLIDVFQQESKKNEIPIADDDQELVSLRLGTSSTDDEVAKGGSDGGDRATSSKNEERSSWPPMKRASSNGDDEVSQTSVKRARVCVRARCDTPTVSSFFFLLKNKLMGYL